jgi:hypothetical protein
LSFAFIDVIIASAALYAEYSANRAGALSTISFVTFLEAG